MRESSKPLHDFCKSCRESLKFVSSDAVSKGLCQECYAEKFLGKIPEATSVFEHGTGGGKRVVRDPKGLS